MEGEDIEEEGEDELDRMIRESSQAQNGGAVAAVSGIAPLQRGDGPVAQVVRETNPMAGGTGVSDDGPGPSENQGQDRSVVMFQRAMISITSLANTMSASSRDRDNLNKALNLLAETNKRRRDDELEEESAVMIDEMIHVKDDGVSVVDMNLRQRLRNINADPADWWLPTVMEKVNRPIIGQHLFLSHLMPGRVNPRTIRRFHDRSVLITAKALSTHNSGVSGEKRMQYRLRATEEDETILMGGRDYQDCKTCFDLVESVFNYAALAHQIRPYSYEGLSLLRSLHHCRYFYGVVEDPKAQKQLLEKYISEVFGYNQRRGSERKSPASFRKCIELAKEVCVTNGYNPDALMMKTDPYCGKRALATGSKREQDLEKENADLKAKLRAAQNQKVGYGSKPMRGGNSFSRGGGRAPMEHNQPAGDLSEVTKRKISETCPNYNSGGNCDGSCGLKHLCANVIRPGMVFIL